MLMVLLYLTALPVRYKRMDIFRMIKKSHAGGGEEYVGSKRGAFMEDKTMKKVKIRAIINKIMLIKIRAARVICRPGGDKCFLHLQG